MRCGCVPMAASTAVIQVPIFCPNSTYTALGKGYDAAVGQGLQDTHRGGGGLDQGREAGARPAIPISGLEKVVIKLTKAG